MTEFLKEENKEIGQSVIDNYPPKGAGYIRFWSEKVVQLDGDFSIDDLKMIVKSMEKFSNSNE